MERFTIAAAQTCSVAGGTVDNVRRHVEWARLASAEGADVVVFPELSLSGYEPTLAAECALTPEDERLLPLLDLSREFGITIVAGCPIPSAGDKPYIGAVIIGPAGPVEIYRKRFIDPDEVPDFVGSDDITVCRVGGRSIGLAICADIGHPEHPADLKARGATIYAAGVMMTPRGVGVAETRLAAYAKKHAMLAVMANHACGSSTLATGGRSAAWDESGRLLARAGADGECLVLARREADGWAGTVIAT